MVAIDAWQERGFGAVAKSYFERFPRESGCAATSTTTAICCSAAWRRATSSARRCCRGWQRRLVRSGEQRAARMKLLRTIRLDASDTFVFDPPAEPGEWAVSGAFVFWGGDPARARRQGAHRVPQRLSRRRLARLVDAGADRGGERSRARRLVEALGAATGAALRRARSGGGESARPRTRWLLSSRCARSRRIR